MGLRPSDEGNLLKTIQELKERVVIVEGKKDVEALHRLGLRDIIPIHGKPLFAVVRGVSREKEVVVLTDFDRQGRRLNARLLTLLHHHKIPTNHRLRQETKGFGKTRIEEIRPLEVV